MKILSASGRNFQSFSELSLDFKELNLALVSGPTGSGKSSLLDLLAWVLFGTTSKDLNSDDVISWYSDETTTGTVTCTTKNSEVITVYRSRSRKPTDNDLYLVDESNSLVRGKDLTETQKLIEQHVGVTAEQFLMAAYLHQFSSVDNFFLAKAADRRKVFDNLADLSLPTLLSSQCSLEKKAVKQLVIDTAKQKALAEGQLISLNASIKSLVQQFDKWEIDNQKQLTELEEKSSNYLEIKKSQVNKLVAELEQLSRTLVPESDLDKKRTRVKQQIELLASAKAEVTKVNLTMARLETEFNNKINLFKSLTALGDTCPTCLGPTDNPHRLSEVTNLEPELLSLENQLFDLSNQRDNITAALTIEEKVHQEYDSLRDIETQNKVIDSKMLQVRAQLEVNSLEQNPYDEQLSNLRGSSNPHESYVEESVAMLAKVNSQLQDLEGKLSSYELRISDLDTLYDISFEARRCLLENAKEEIQDETNRLLENYFEAPLRMSMQFEDQDKLQLEIINNSNSCKYKQLSGGERCMLKLCFYLARKLRIENVLGVKFDTIMLDEAFNGLNAELKEKAFKLLKQLEKDHDSVLVVDHTDSFKEMFDTRIEVVNQGGVSSVQE